MIPNPFSPQHTDSLADLTLEGASIAVDVAERPSRIGNGPSVVICFGGLCGLLVALPLLGAPQNPVHWTFSATNMNLTTIGIVIALSGWIIGGLVYRKISERWPRDPSVLSRQIIVSLFSQVFPVLIVYLIFGATYPHLLALAVCFGLSIVIAVMASGRRRFPARPKTVEPWVATKSAV